MRDNRSLAFFTWVARTWTGRIVWTVLCLAVFAGVFFAAERLSDGGGDRSISVTTVDGTPASPAATAILPALQFDVSQARNFGLGMKGGTDDGHYETGAALARDLTASTLAPGLSARPNLIYVCPDSTATTVRLLEKATDGTTYLAQAGFNGPVTAARGNCSGF